MNEHSDFSDDLSARLRILQIIVATLIMGLVLFGVIVLFMALQPSAGTSTAGTTQAPTDVLRLVWAFLLLMEMPFYFVFRGITKRDAVMNERLTDEYIFQRYFVITLIGAALAEGVSLFGAVITLISRQPVDAALILPGLLAMALLFPTVGRFDAYRRSIHDARMINGMTK